MNSRPFRLRGPLRQRSFRRVFVASSLSGFGGSATFAALPLVAWQQTHSAQAMSTMLLLGAVGQLGMTLFGGVIADRYDRRVVLNCVDVGSLIALICMAIAVTQGAWTLAAIAFAFHQAGTATGNATQPAVVRSLLEDAERVQGNALIQGTGGVIRLTGPAIGAALLGLAGFWAVIALDGASYVVSLMLILPLRDPRLAAAERTTPKEGWARSFVRDLREGFAVVRSDKFLSITRVASSINGVANGMLLTSVVPWLIGVRHAGHYAYAICCAMLGLGGIISSAAVARAGNRIAPRLLLRWGCAIVGLGALLLAGFEPVSAVYAGHAVIGIGFSATMVAFTTIMQQRVPSAFVGRVSSIGILCFMGPYIAAVAIAGVLVDHIGASATMSIAAAAFAINSTLYIWASWFVDEQIPATQTVEDPALTISG